MALPGPDKPGRLSVLVHPGKKSDRLYFVGQEVHIDLTARPVDGKANEALLRLVGNVLSIAPSLVSLKRGLTSRYKEILVPLSQEELLARIRQKGS